MSKPLVGISSCLMGNKVRYDGKDKLNSVIQKQIAPFVSLLPICPEAAVGLGIPRPPVQLIQTANRIEAIGRDDNSINVTNRLEHFGDVITRVHTRLCGYILQSRSPSCGFGTTPIFDEEKKQIGLGNGLVAQRLKDNMPHLVIVNDTDLTNAQSIRQFLEAVTAAHQKFT